MAQPAARTQVGIVGAGPAGLLLSHLLARAGVESVVLERATRAHLESACAPACSSPDVRGARRRGTGRAPAREGLAHDGIELRFAGRRHRIDSPRWQGARSPSTGSRKW
jgi:p-hydroxybenzoate 3-monooxygenase